MKSRVVFVIPGIVWLALTVLGGCSRVFFVPDTRLIRTPGDIGMRYESVSIPVDDGVSLSAWYLPGKAPVLGTVVFLHGNAQNISYHLPSVHWLPKARFNVLTYDYRGFGVSGGRSNLENAIADFCRVMQWLELYESNPDTRRFIFGQSLGGTIAIAGTAQCKSEFVFSGLIADSAFSGFREIAREKASEVFWLRPFAPALGWAIPDQPDVRRAIHALAPIPVMLIHGGQDTIVPVAHARTLYDSARDPKDLWIEPAAKHIGALANPDLRARMLQFMQ
ncbi:MAG: alpha/beta hydrolase [Thiotrichales bacterium]